MRVFKPLARVVVKTRAARAERSLERLVFWVERLADKRHLFCFADSAHELRNARAHPRRERCARRRNHGRGQNCARKALGMPLQRHSADCAAHRMRIQAERQVFRARQNDVIHERFQIVYVIRKMIDVRQPRFLN